MSDPEILSPSVSLGCRSIRGEYCDKAQEAQSISEIFRPFSDGGKFVVVSFQPAGRYHKAPRPGKREGHRGLVISKQIK